MTLVKHKIAPVSKASPVDRLASEIFGSNISRLFGSDDFTDHSPRVNIIESHDEFRLEMQAPGFDMKDLKIEMVDDTLTIAVFIRRKDRRKKPAGPAASSFHRC
jgi:HSP20 family molecular chaperone IbpA